MSASGNTLKAKLLGPAMDPDTKPDASGELHFSAEQFAINLTDFRDQIDVMIDRLKNQKTIVPATATTRAVKEEFEIAFTLDFYNNKTAKVALQAAEIDGGAPNKLIVTLTCYCNGGG